MEILEDFFTVFIKVKWEVDFFQNNFYNFIIQYKSWERKKIEYFIKNHENIILKAGKSTDKNILILKYITKGWSDKLSNRVDNHGR